MDLGRTSRSYNTCGCSACSIATQADLGKGKRKYRAVQVHPVIPCGLFPYRTVAIPGVVRRLV